MMVVGLVMMMMVVRMVMGLVRMMMMMMVGLVMMMMMMMVGLVMMMVVMVGLVRMMMMSRRMCVASPECTALRTLRSPGWTVAVQTQQVFT